MRWNWLEELFVIDLFDVIVVYCSSYCFVYYFFEFWIIFVIYDCVGFFVEGFINDFVFGWVGSCCY